MARTFRYEKASRFPDTSKMGRTFCCVTASEMNRAGLNDRYGKVFFRSADGKTVCDIASVLNFIMFFCEACMSDDHGLLPDGSRGMFICTDDETLVPFVDDLVKTIESFDAATYKVCLPSKKS